MRNYNDLSTEEIELFAEEWYGEYTPFFPCCAFKKVSGATRDESQGRSDGNPWGNRVGRPNGLGQKKGALPSSLISH